MNKKEETYENYPGVIIYSDDTLFDRKPVSYKQYEEGILRQRAKQANNALRNYLIPITPKGTGSDEHQTYTENDGGLDVIQNMLNLRKQVGFYRQHPDAFIGDSISISRAQQNLPPGATCISTATFPYGVEYVNNNQFFNDAKNNKSDFKLIGTLDFSDWEDYDPQKQFGAIIEALKQLNIGDLISLGVSPQKNSEIDFDFDPYYKRNVPYFHHMMQFGGFKYDKNGNIIGFYGDQSHGGQSISALDHKLYTSNDAARLGQIFNFYRFYPKNNKIREHYLEYSKRNNFVPYKNGGKLIRKRK